MPLASFLVGYNIGRLLPPQGIRAVHWGDGALMLYIPAAQSS